MQINQYSRKPFAVNAVQVTLQNVEEIARWCRGEVGEAKVKMMGTETVLPCVRISGQGPKKGEKFEALLGHWVVEHKGSFRVYRPQQFDATFEAMVVTGDGSGEVLLEVLEEGDPVVVLDEQHLHYSKVGKVKAILEEGRVFGVALEDGSDDLFRRGALGKLSREQYELELKVVQNNHIQGKLQEFLPDNWITVDSPGHDYHGITGKVTVVGTGDNGEDIEVLFSDGEYKLFKHNELKCV